MRVSFHFAKILWDNISFENHPLLDTHTHTRTSLDQREAPHHQTHATTQLEMISATWATASPHCILYNIGVVYIYVYLLLRLYMYHIDIFVCLCCCVCVCTMHMHDDVYSLSTRAAAAHHTHTHHIHISSRVARGMRVHFNSRSAAFEWCVRVCANVHAASAVAFSCLRPRVRSQISGCVLCCAVRVCLRLLFIFLPSARARLAHVCLVCDARCVFVCMCIDAPRFFLG